MMMELAWEVTINFPQAKLVISSMLPRKAGNLFTASEALKYNNIAKKFGQMLTREARLDLLTSPSFVPSLNRNIWGRISRAEAKESLFDFGGLHLTSEGKVVLAREWITAMNTP